jgi:hypothetical protein
LACFAAIGKSAVGMIEARIDSVLGVLIDGCLAATGLTIEPW